MNEIYTITSDSGDEYKLQFSSDRSGIIADAILDHLNNNGIEVVEIGLGRVKGLNVTNHQVLSNRRVYCRPDAKASKCDIELFLRFYTFCSFKKEYSCAGISQQTFFRNVQ